MRGVVFALALSAAGLVSGPVSGPVSGLVLGIGFAQAAELPRAEPSELGFSAARLERVTEWMQSYVDESRLAGAQTLVIRRGRIAYFESVGQADIARGTPITGDTIFRIYSMTKPVTAVAVMILVEEGRLKLTDPVGKYLPDLKDRKIVVEDEEGNRTLRPARRDITVEDLLTHTAGLSYAAIQQDPVAEQYLEEGILPGYAPQAFMLMDEQERETWEKPAQTLQEMMGRVGKLPLAYDPGTDWHYSIASDVLGRLVEVVAGMPYDRFLKSRIFDPLKMDDTSFQVAQDNVARFAANYRRPEEGGLELFDDPLESRYTKPVSLFAGGAGLVSTARDYARFCQMLLNGGELDGVRILSPKTVQIMTMDHLPDGVTLDYFPGAGFGLGFGVVEDIAEFGALGTNGTYFWGGAASTAFWIDPKEDLAVVFMTQMIPSSTYALRPELKTLVYQAMTESAVRP